MATFHLPFVLSSGSSIEVAGLEPIELPIVLPLLLVSSPPWLPLLDSESPLPLNTSWYVGG
jgi:hypothetical protein